LLLVEAAIHDGYRSSDPRHWIITSGGRRCAISVRACLHIGSALHFPFFKEHCRIPHQDPGPRTTSHLANITSNRHFQIHSQHRDASRSLHPVGERRKFVDHFDGGSQGHQTTPRQICSVGIEGHRHACGRFEGSWTLGTSLRRHGVCITSNKVVRLLLYMVSVRRKMGDGQLWDEKTERFCVRG
jgi:hypothetical protein